MTKQPIPLYVVYYNGKFVRCYDNITHAARQQPHVALIGALRKPPPIFGDGFEGSFLVNLEIDGVVVVENAEIVSVPGRRYRNVQHLFLVAQTETEENNGFS